LSWLDDSGLADLTPDGAMVLFGDRTRVFLRRTDGSAPARLGEGYADALSPDGKWALTTTTARDRLVVTPTGAGQPRALDRHDVTSYGGAAWFPDGKRILFNGRAPGIALRCYVRHLETNEVRALTPEGRWCLSVSPDGRFVAAIGQDTGIWLHEANGGRAEAVPGSEPGDRPGGWSADGSSLWVFRRGEVPACIHRLNVTTGRRTPWKCVVPRDATGVTSITDIRVTPDGRSYAYSYRRVLSELYVVTGLD
jgi:Tol biopolymer transport system component